MCIDDVLSRWRLGAAALFFAVLSSTAAAQGAEDERVQPLAKCPWAGDEYGACLMVFFLSEKPVTASERKAPTKDNPYRTLTHQRVEIEGRLADGPLAKYILDLAPREFGETDDPSRSLGTLPYIGRSDRNRPIILTDRGPFEITDPSIDFPPIPSLTLLREKDMSIVARYFDVDGSTFIVTKSGEVGVWDATRNVCVTPPRKVPQSLAIVTHACRAAGLQTAGEDKDEAGGNVVSAPDLRPAPELIQKIYGDSVPGTFIDRVPNTGYIIIKSDWDEDCC